MENTKTLFDIAKQGYRFDNKIIQELEKEEKIALKNGRRQSALIFGYSVKWMKILNKEINNKIDDVEKLILDKNENNK